VEVSSIKEAVRFVREWTGAPGWQRSALGKRMPVFAIQAAALMHPDPMLRRSCLFLLDHYDCDGSTETFRKALRDPVSFVRESALHGIACERCRHEAICVSDVVGDLVQLLATDPNPDVRHKTIVALGRLLDRDTRALEAVAKTAQSDPDAAIRFVACEMVKRGQPHHRSRNAALRDERRARRARV
jgi:HEAT repeat protein